MTKRKKIRSNLPLIWIAKSEGKMKLHCYSKLRKATFNVSLEKKKNYYYTLDVEIIKNNNFKHYYDEFDIPGVDEKKQIEIKINLHTKGEKINDDNGKNKIIYDPPREDRKKRKAK